jgi:hypothetical protein
MFVGLSSTIEDASSTLSTLSLSPSVSETLAEGMGDVCLIVTWAVFGGRELCLPPLTLTS